MQVNKVEFAASRDDRAAQVQQPKPAAKAAHLARVLEGDHPEAYVFLAKAAHLDGDPARAVGELEVPGGDWVGENLHYDSYSVRV